MGLGDRFWNWLKSIDLTRWLVDGLDGMRARRDSITEGLRETIPALVNAGQVGQAALVILSSVLFVLIGPSIFTPQNLIPGAQGVTDELKAFQASPQRYLREKIDGFMKDPSTREFTEFLGSIITEPVVSLLEDYAARPDPDPHAFARSFHGIATGLPLAAKASDAVANAVMGERAPKIGEVFTTIYWGLGLGFLGWQTLAPLLSSGLQPNLQRYYNKLYRPSRFTPGQIQDLFALGKITGGAFDDYLRELGWRDQDIGWYRELSYRPIPESDCWKLYHDGTKDKDWMDARLRAFGYNTADFELIYKANPADDEASVKGYTISTLKSALEKRLIGETEFREIMTSLRYQQREIDLQVALIRAKQTQDARDLTTGQIKELYNQRIIGRDEAATNLRQLGYDAPVADQLIRAWDQEALPKAIRLNKSTILEAFTAGVYTRSQAITSLQDESGYSAAQAELLVKVEEAQIKRQALAGLPKPATLAQLQGFVEYGLITRAELEARPELSKYDDATRALLVNLIYAQLQVQPPTGQPSQGVIADAYVFGLLSRDDYLARLEARGFTPEDAELQAQVVEAANPLAFGGAEDQPVRVPSVPALQLALQRGLIDEAGFRERLAAQGYTDEAITISLFNAQYQAPASPKSLTQSQIISLYKSTDITRADATRRLLGLGYTAPDAELLIRQVRLAPEDTDAGAYYLAGLLSEDGVIVALDAEGFSTDEIASFLDAVAAGEIV
jgi:hypothetical protein